MYIKIGIDYIIRSHSLLGFSGDGKVSHDRDRSKQLDEEIKLCIANHGPISGYCVIKCTQAPKNTVLYKLKRLVELGELDCKEARKGKVYSLPKTVADLPDGRRKRKHLRWYPEGRRRPGRAP